MLEDFEHCDAIFYFGQNPGSNSPRFLHQPAGRGAARLQDHHLQSGARKGPASASSIRKIRVEMLTGQATELSYMYLQVRPGGDIAALMGLCKHVVAVDDVPASQRSRGVIDRDFLQQPHRWLRNISSTTMRAADWDGDRARFRPRARRSGGGGRCLYRRRARHRRLRHGPHPACAWDAEHRHARQPAAVARKYRPPGRGRFRRCAAIPTCRASAPSAFPKSPNSCRSTSSRKCSISSRRAKRD